MLGNSLTTVRSFYCKRLRGPRTLQWLEHNYRYLHTISSYIRELRQWWPCTYYETRIERLEIKSRLPTGDLAQICRIFGNTSRIVGNRTSNIFLWVHIPNYYYITVQQAQCRVSSADFLVCIYTSTRKNKQRFPARRRRSLLRRCSSTNTAPYRAQIKIHYPTTRPITK